MEHLIIGILLVVSVNSQNLSFVNPIVGGYSGNPSILKLGDYYYLTLQSYSFTELIVYKSRILTSFLNVESSVILRAPEGFSTLEPSEMFKINGELYLYFHMHSKAQDGRRLFVIRADDPSDPLGKWGEPVRLLHDWDYNVVDGTVLNHNNQFYFIWTNAGLNYSLFIAPMTSLTWVGNPKVKIREPREPWECESSGTCHVAGSSILYGHNVSYLVYSANAWSSPDYCLGQMSVRDGADPLILGNWEFHKEPVFGRNDDDDVYGTGAAEFTTSPDGTETWMIYHASVCAAHVVHRQTARLEKIEWNAGGGLRFPQPQGIHRLKPLPSGQHSICA